MWAWILPTLLARRPTPFVWDEDPVKLETNHQRSKRLFEERLRQAETGQWRRLIIEYVVERCDVELAADKPFDDAIQEQQTEEHGYMRATAKLDTASVRAATNLLQMQPRAPATVDANTEILKLVAEPADEEEKAATQKQCELIRAEIAAGRAETIGTKTIKAIARHLAPAAEPGPSQWRNADIKEVVRLPGGPQT